MISTLLPPQSHIESLYQTPEKEIKDVFFSPQTLTPLEIQACQETSHLDMKMGLDPLGEQYFHFITLKDQVWLSLFFLKEIPPIFSEDEQTLFHKEMRVIDGVEKEVFALTTHLSTSPNLHPYIQKNSTEITTSRSSAYTASERRIFKDANPQPISEEELKRIILSQNALFYTGAGLSVSAGVPSMNELLSLLGIEKNHDPQQHPFAAFLKKILQNPQDLAEKIAYFHKQCFHCPPTLAHQTLKEISVKYQIPIVTENLDCLHEQTGIAPHRIDPQKLNEISNLESIKQLDAVICCGLSYDDRGFLAWLKNHHPDLKIISIDLSKPNYLGDEDFLLQKDLQEFFSTFD